MRYWNSLRDQFVGRDCRRVARVFESAAPRAQVLRLVGAHRRSCRSTAARSQLLPSRRLPVVTHDWFSLRDWTVCVLYLQALIRPSSSFFGFLLTPEQSLSIQKLLLTRSLIVAAVTAAVFASRRQPRRHHSAPSPSPSHTAAAATAHALTVAHRLHCTPPPPPPQPLPLGETQSAIHVFCLRWQSGDGFATPA